MSKLQDTVFAIVGLGLIGGSYAKALKNLKVKNIIGFDTNDIVALMAKDEGMLTEIGSLDSGAGLEKADVIICAMYPAAMLKFIHKHVRHFKKQVMLTDVLGIKEDIPDKVDALLGPEMDFVSGHPMAGREGKGYGQSAAEIFNGCNYIVIKRSKNKPEHVVWLKEFAKALGSKNVIEVTPQDHDAIIAYTSNLPHVLAVALVNSISLNDNTKYFIAGSFRDATRVADINAALWQELMLHNRENLLEEIERYQKQLEEWKTALTNQDAAKIRSMMEQAKARREELFNAKNYR